ncbi:unnamed protein product, partial [Closterium sp. NIES-54]
FKIALCQLAVGADKARNIEHVRDVIGRAADQGARLVLLPEMWNCPYSNDNFPTYAEEISLEDSFASSPSAAMLADVAGRHGVTIVGGSIPEKREGRLYNTCLVFGSKGELKGRFSKLHLFDIDIPGKITFKESDTLTRGEHPLVVDTGGLPVCVYLVSACIAK